MHADPPRNERFDPKLSCSPPDCLLPCVYLSLSLSLAVSVSISLTLVSLALCLYLFVLFPPFQSLSLSRRFLPLLLPPRPRRARLETPK